MSTVDWIVTFDVPSDARRRVLTRALERLGPRVAYSVFAVRIPAAGMVGLVQRLREPVGDAGHLLALPVCADCGIAVFGGALEQLPGAGWVSG